MRATAGCTAGVVLLGGSLAGCGDDDSGNGGEKDFADRDYAEIKEAAIEAMSSLESLRVVARVKSDDQPSTVDIAMSADGRCAGTLTFGKAKAEVLRTSDGAWYKPNAELLAEAYSDRKDKVLEFVGDAWVVDSDDEVTGRNCDLEAFLDRLDDGEETDFEVVGSETIGGEPVVRIDYETDEAEGSAYIRSEPEHYIVRIDIESDSGKAEAEFSGFDEDVVADPPGEDQIVDLADFAD